MRIFKNKAFGKWAAKEGLADIALQAAAISDKELKALRLYADILLNYSKTELNKAVAFGELIEVINNG